MKSLIEKFSLSAGFIDPEYVGSRRRSSWYGRRAWRLLNDPDPGHNRRMVIRFGPVLDYKEALPPTRIIQDLAGAGRGNSAASDLSNPLYSGVVFHPVGFSSAGDLSTCAAGFRLV